jgi:DNA polymerase-3 subunit alpha
MVWIPLNVHSQYSILDSTASVTSLVKKASEYSLPYLALTDNGNMYAAVEFYKACVQSKIRPIIGCQLHVAPHSRFDKKRIPGFSAGYPIVLLAKDLDGYKNLCKLSSMAHIEGFYYTPRIDKELLKQHSKGLVCLSGSIFGSIGFNILQNKIEELKADVQWFQEVFGGDYYFEIQRHSMSSEGFTNS